MGKHETCIWDTWDTRSASVLFREMKLEEAGMPLGTPLGRKPPSSTVESQIGSRFRGVPQDLEATLTELRRLELFDAFRCLSERQQHRFSQCCQPVFPAGAAQYRSCLRKRGAAKSGSLTRPWVLTFLALEGTPPPRSSCSPCPSPLALGVDPSGPEEAVGPWCCAPARRRLLLSVSVLDQLPLRVSSGVLRVRLSSTA